MVDWSCVCSRRQRLTPHDDALAEARTQSPAFRGSASYSLLVAITLLVYVHALLGRAALEANRAAAQQALSPLYLINIIFFAGASGGVIILGAIARASSRNGVRPFSTAAKLAAAAGLSMVTMFIALDVLRGGHPWYVRRADVVPALIQELPVTAIYLAHAAALAYFASRFDLMAGMRRWPLRRMASHVFAVARSITTDPATAHRRGKAWLFAKWLLPAAVLLRSVPLWMEGLAEIEPGSRILLIAAPCYASCVISGLALVAVVATTHRNVRALDVTGATVRGLGGVLRLLLPILGYGVFAEMWMTLEARDPIRQHLFAELVVGSYAPFFWFALVGGMIVPFLLLASPPAPTIGRTRLAALLTVLGVLVVRWSTVVPALLGHAHRLYAAGGYAPTVLEASRAIAVYAAGLLLYLLRDAR